MNAVLFGTADHYHGRIPAAPRGARSSRSMRPAIHQIDASDMAAVAAGVSRFLAVESCGQCSPCKLDGENLAERLVDSAHPLGHALTVAGASS